MGFKAKLILGVAGTGLLLFTGAAVLVHNFLGEAEIPYAQDPNAVEAREAERKIKLLEDALNAKRKGYVRLTEVEINSLLERHRFATNNVRTKYPVDLVKARVLIDSSNVTLVTWQKGEFFGFPVTFVWQRAFLPLPTTNGTALKVTGMRLGNSEVPRRFWRPVADYLGQTDKMFEEKKVWLAEFPTIAVRRNELTRVPELRLYTYVESKDPKENNAQASKESTQAANTVAAKSNL